VTVEVSSMGTTSSSSATATGAGVNGRPRGRVVAVPVRTGAVGGFFLTMGGVHVGIVAGDPQTYRHFADGALFGFVRTGWVDVFMAHPAVWGLVLAAGEVVMGSLLLAGGRAARAGWVAVVTFHVLLMLFGWGFWVWSVPALALLVAFARRDWRSLGV
jgi:hypothetical protein